MAGGCLLCSCTGHNWEQSLGNELVTKELEWTPATWRPWSQRSSSPLFEVPGASGACVAVDYMHLKYLGADQYFFGGIFYMLVYCILGADPLQNLQVVWCKMKDLYKTKKVPVTYKYFNRLSMFKRKTGPPKLRGRAAEVRWLHKIMPDLWLSFCNTDLLLHRQVLVTLKLSSHVESLLDQYKGFNALPQPAAQQFKVTMFQTLHLQHMVATHFDWEEDLPSICSITMKHHMLQHLALHCHELSPRLVWCFTGEDNMGIMKVLCQGCARGVAPEDVAMKMMLHWRYAMHLELVKE